MKQTRKNYIKVGSAVAMVILAFTFLVASMSVGNYVIDQRVNAQNEKRLEWIYSELERIQQRHDVVDDMLKAGQITHYEHYLLEEQCIKEKQTIPQRIPF